MRVSVMKVKLPRIDHAEQQHQEHAVEEVDDLRGVGRLGLGGEEGDQHEGAAAARTRHSARMSASISRRGAISGRIAIASSASR